MSHYNDFARYPPREPLKMYFAINPSRGAEEILGALLDVCVSLCMRNPYSTKDWIHYCEKNRVFIYTRDMNTVKRLFNRYKTGYPNRPASSVGEICYGFGPINEAEARRIGLFALIMNAHASDTLKGAFVHPNL